MPEQIKRSLFLNANKFQKQIIYPILIASSACCVMVFLCLEYYLASISPSKVMVLGFDAIVLKEAVPFLFIAVLALLIFIVLWTYHISNKIVGPTGRINRELDEILSGKRRKKLGVRKGDVLFEELLQRVNALIEKNL